MAYDSSNIFARILRGEIPCTKVFEDEHVLAFRDIHPAAPVHVLVIPKGAYVSAQDFAEKASAAEQMAFFAAIASIARTEGVVEGGYRLISNHGVAANQEVPHFHMHILGGRPLGGMIARPA
jgi:diadenosine tetraphosphate (Ap4A) HIT family hydrolase